MGICSLKVQMDYAIEIACNEIIYLTSFSFNTFYKLKFWQFLGCHLLAFKINTFWKSFLVSQFVRFSTILIYHS